MHGLANACKPNDAEFLVREVFTRVKAKESCFRNIRRNRAGLHKVPFGQSLL
jgi:hypothetical protein